MSHSFDSRAYIRTVGWAGVRVGAPGPRSVAALHNVHGFIRMAWPARVLWLPTRLTPFATTTPCHARRKRTYLPRRPSAVSDLHVILKLLWLRKGSGWRKNGHRGIKEGLEVKEKTWKGEENRHRQRTRVWDIKKIPRREEKEMENRNKKGRHRRTM